MIMYFITFISLVVAVFMTGWVWSLKQEISTLEGQPAGHGHHTVGGNQHHSAVRASAKKEQRPAAVRRNASGVPTWDLRIQ
jgi:hypothetical protein